MMKYLDKFLDQDLVVIDSFLNENQFLDLLLIKKRYMTNLVPAKVGEKGKVFSEGTIRRDKICWLDPLNSDKELKDFFKKLDHILLYMNQQFYLGLKHIESHLAYYAPGDFYKKHMDCHAKGSTRKLTFIYYLNPYWENGDGGELKIYQPDSFEIIEPKGNRLVLFLSEKIPHEVLPANIERWSITGWFHQ